ncbi:MAG: murein L,D-transpeptidase catalytic domain family protein [Deltaproteobacteria bacterium]|nr:murein L,D-transpeptidase catalytic domain family protein [Deltaproteobacteria bacterium]
MSGAARRLAFAAAAALGLLGVASVVAWRAVYGLPDAASAELWAWLDAHPSAVAPGRAVFLIDLSRPSPLPRGWLLDPTTREVLAVMHVAHGKESGWARVEKVSNVEGSHQSSIGAMRGAALYVGKHGRSLRLEGLDPGVNDDALARAIVLHGADYVSWQSVWDNQGRLGRSLGCPAVPLDQVERVITALEEGGVVYTYWRPIND